MNDQYAAKIYPVVQYVLGMLDQINGGEEEPVPAETLPRLKQMVGVVEGEGVERKGYELAKRALVYWVDEVLVNSKWSRTVEWQNNTLERELYDARERAWKFFDAARSARAFGHSDPLETYYLCVALGFRGVYRDQGTGSPAPPRQQPTEDVPESPDAAQGLTWFGDSGLFNSEDTWGLGNRPQPKENSLMDSGLNLGPQAGEGTTYGLPRTLEEWAGPVYAQVAPPVTKNFVPTLPGEPQRDARPLKSQHSFEQALRILMFSAIASVCLLALWFATG